MNHVEKFEAFKADKLLENERQYGDEMKEKYNSESLESARKKWGELSEKQFLELEEAEKKVILGLNDLLKSKEVDLTSIAAKQIFKNHRQWLSITSDFYTPEFHKCIGAMYVTDERFANYYNEKTEKPSVTLLSEIINFYTD